MKRLSWIAIIVFAVFVVFVFALTLARRSQPFVVGPALLPGKVTPQVLATYDRAYLLAPDGSLWAWGGTRSGKADTSLPGALVTPRQVGTSRDWLKFAAGDSHVAAIKTDHSLWAWGDNTAGQLGVPGQISNSAPVRIGFENDWQEVSAGWSHNLALKTNGSLWGWGRNEEGVVGDPAQTNWFEPREILPGSHWRAISAGNFNSYAIRDDGTLWRWGFSALPGSTKNDLVPRQIGNDTNWAAISAGDFHLLALKRDGSVWIHGQNAHVVAPGEATGPVTGLTQIGGDLDWREIYGGATLRKVDGSWWVCGHWGQGKTRHDSPQRIGWDFDPWAFSAQGSTSILLAKDGTLWTWRDRLGSKQPRELLQDALLWAQLRLSGRGGSVYYRNLKPIVDYEPYKVWDLPAQTNQPRPANTH